MMDGAPAPGLLDVSVRADVEAIQKLAENFVLSFSQRASKASVGHLQSRVLPSCWFEKLARNLGGSHL